MLGRWLFIVQKCFFLSYKKKEYTLIQSAYNHTVILPAILTSLPGKVFKYFNARASILLIVYYY